MAYPGMRFFKKMGSSAARYAPLSREPTNAHAHATTPHMMLLAGLFLAGSVRLRFYSETCFHIRRLFPKGGHQHWFFGHDADFVVVTYEFLGFGIFVPCR